MHLFGVWINRLDLRQTEFKIFLAAQNASHRVGDFVSGNSCGGHLIKKRLK